MVSSVPPPILCELVINQPTNSVKQVTGYSFGRRFYPKRLTSSANNRDIKQNIVLTYIPFVCKALSAILAH